MDFSKQQLLSFLDKATRSTYVGGGKAEEHPEREGFTELAYQEGNFSYRDSYTGFYLSWGEEIVRFNDKPIWTSLYGGGMVEGKEALAEATFGFLKKAMSQREEGFFSVRGPHLFEEEDFKHTYTQNGDYDNFSGHQEIFYKGELVFFHNVIGGLVKGK